MNVVEQEVGVCAARMQLQHHLFPPNAASVHLPSFTPSFAVMPLHSRLISVRIQAVHDDVVSPVHEEWFDVKTSRTTAFCLDTKAPYFQSVCFLVSAVGAGNIHRFDDRFRVRRRTVIYVVRTETQWSEMLPQSVHAM